MDGYMCHNCRSRHKDGETFYSVLCTDGLHVPTCSIECFNIVKEKQIKKLKNKLKEIEEQFPNAMTW